MSWRLELSNSQRFSGKAVEMNCVRAVEDIKWYDFVGFCVSWAVMSFVCSTVKTRTHTQFTNKPAPCSVPPPTSSVCQVVFVFVFVFIHTIFFWLLFSTRWIYLLNMRNPKIFFHISVYFLRFLVYIFYMSYISLMVNGYISWICKSIWWLCTVSIKGMRLSCSQQEELVQCEEGWKLTTPQQNIFTSRKKTKHVLLWKRNNNGMKSTLRHINISSIFQETTSFCYFRKKELCRVWMKCKKRQEIFFFVVFLCLDVR